MPVTDIESVCWRTAARIFFVFIALSYYSVAQEYTKEYTDDETCRKMATWLGPSDPHAFDNCLYNGVTFKEWRKFHSAWGAATSTCKATHWTGATELWDVFRHEWRPITCKSFRKVLDGLYDNRH